MKSRRRRFACAAVGCALMAASLWFREAGNTTEPLKPAELIVDLGDSSYSSRVVVAINNREQLVALQFTESERQAFVYSTTNVSDLVGLTELASGRGINNLGQVAGSIIVDSWPRAAVWDTEGGGKLIGDIDGRSIANGINDLGEVVGVYLNEANHYRGFRWNSRDGIRDISHEIGTKVGSAMAINNSRQIVGTALLDGMYRAFLWSPEEGVVDLGTPPTEGSSANGINNDGTVVGHYRVKGQMRAFVWSEELGFVDLNDLLPVDSGWQLFAAWDINDKDQIVGMGTKDGVARDFMVQLDSLGSRYSPQQLGAPKTLETLTQTSDAPSGGIPKLASHPTASPAPGRIAL